MMITWPPFTRQIDEIGETRSIAFHNRWQEPLNGFVPNSNERRVWSFARKSLKVKVKSQRSRSTGTKNALCTYNTSASTEWNALAANNVTQAAVAALG